MSRVVRGIEAARRAAVYVCDREDNHRGQGLLLDLGSEGTVVLTCHHVIAPVKPDDLRVRIPQANGELGRLIPAQYDQDHSYPEMDAVVLRIDDTGPYNERPLLHKLNLDTYDGWLRATGITYRRSLPDSFTAWVAASKPVEIPVKIPGHWPDPPECYRPRAFRLSMTTDARQGISGGVVLCEDGVLGLVESARAEGDRFGREDYLLPLTTWSEGWPALERLIEPLIEHPGRYRHERITVIKWLNEVPDQMDSYLKKLWQLGFGKDRLTAREWAERRAELDRMDSERRSLVRLYSRLLQAIPSLFLQTAPSEQMRAQFDEVFPAFKREAEACFAAARRLESAMVGPESAMVEADGCQVRIPFSMLYEALDVAEHRRIFRLAAGSIVDLFPIDEVEEARR